MILLWKGTSVPVSPFWKDRGAVPPPCIHPPASLCIPTRTLFTRFCRLQCVTTSINYRRSPKTAVHNCKNIRQRVKTRPVNTGRGIGGQCSPIFCAPQYFFVPRKIFIKTYNENKNLASIKTRFAPQNLNSACGLGKDTGA